MKNSPTIDDKQSGKSGVWWHDNNRGPLEKIPYIGQFGSMRFSKVQMDDNMSPHLNNGIEIHYIESGRYDWVVQNRKIELLPDNLSVTAPWHWNGSPNGKMDIGKINWLIIRPKQFDIDKPLKLGSWTRLSSKFQKELGHMIADDSRVVINNAKHFKKYFSAIKRELADQKKGFRLIIQNQIDNILIELFRELSLQKQTTEEETLFIESFTKLVMNDLDSKWVIEELAYKHGMGKTKFTNEVKRLTGYPPNSFIINLKIEKAIELMTENPKMDLAHIAYRCGFSSLQHFSRTFNQRIGKSPSYYKNDLFAEAEME